LGLSKKNGSVRSTGPWIGRTGSKIWVKGLAQAD